MVDRGQAQAGAGIAETRVPGSMLQQLLREGHTYFGGDGDGEACEALK